MNRTYAHYELELQLNSGGMGEVWLAHDTRPPQVANDQSNEPTRTDNDQRVALKIPNFQCNVPIDAVLRRFAREAQTLSRLAHPGVVRHIESCPCGDQPYIAMEYVDGVTLHEIEKRCSYGEAGSTTGNAVSVAHQLAETLAWLHGEAGLIHRDVKPENIMLTDEGRLVLLDFGIALQTDQTRLTRPHDQLLGSHRYMAPEQFAMPPRLSFGVDVYAFGVVIYELITGRRPGEKKYISIRRVNKKLSKSWDAFLRRCLELDSQKRFGDGVELLAAFEALPARDAAEFIKHKAQPRSSCVFQQQPVTEPIERELSPCTDLVLVGRNAAARPPVKRRINRLTLGITALLLCIALGFYGAKRFDQMIQGKSDRAQKIVETKRTRPRLDSTLAPTIDSPGIGTTSAKTFSEIVDQLRTGEVVPATNSLAILVAKNPRDEGLRVNLALLYIQQGQHRVADQTVREGLKYSPDSSRLKKALELMPR